MIFKREFGKVLPGLKIREKEANYPVLNERDVRAAAGIMLALGAFAFANALLAKQFIYLQIFVVLFFIEFGIRIFINPYYAPLYALGRLFVKNQEPEWAGAVQKLFAWGIGFAMASAMLIVAVILGVRGIVPFSLCSICLFFLWAESALGICIGCSIYKTLINKNIIKPKVRAACPGGVCELKKQ